MAGLRVKMLLPALPWANAPKRGMWNDARETYIRIGDDYSD